MSLRVDWEQIRAIHSNLQKEGATDDTQFTFVLTAINGQSTTTIIPFSNFMKYFWVVCDANHPDVASLTVQDAAGKVIYDIRQSNNSNEQVPVGGHTDVIVNWNSLSPARKKLYLRLMESQINAYER